MVHDIRALTMEWFEKVWNQRDDSVIDRIAAADVVSRGLGESAEPVRGTAQLKQFRAAFLAAFPDLHIHINDVLVDGDKTATRISFTGTHTGEGLGIPATGRRIASTAIVIAHWRDGRIVEAYNEFDAAGMMRQLQAPAAKLRP